MPEFSIVIPGKAAPKSVTFTRRGAYNNKRVREWMDWVRDSVVALRPAQIPHVPTGIVIDVFLAWPKNTPKKLAATTAAHIQKPDADNLLKPIVDALSEAGLWKDDNQIDKMFIQKWRCPIGQERAGIIVRW